MFGMIDYVKIKKSQWEKIKEEFRKMEKENLILKEKLNAMKSYEEMFETIKTQSKTIEKLALENEKNKELLDFYEKSFYELKDKISIKNQEIYDLQQQLKEKENEIQQLKNKLNAVNDLYSFVVNKYVKKEKKNKCPDYQEVSLIDLKV